MSPVKKKQKKQLDELPGFGKLLAKTLADDFKKVIKINRAGRISK